MKKILPLLLCMMLLVGCSAPAPDWKPPEVAEAQGTPLPPEENPWHEFETATEMEQCVGFTFDVPDRVQDVGTITTYRAIVNATAEVIYENGLTLRKAEGTGDISGDDSEYAVTHTTSTLDESGTVEMMGSEDLVYKAIWQMGGYTYAATSEGGLPVHVMAQLVMQIQ